MQSNLYLVVAAVDPMFAAYFGLEHPLTLAGLAAGGFPEMAGGFPEIAGEAAVAAAAVRTRPRTLRAPGRRRDSATACSTSWPTRCQTRRRRGRQSRSR